MIVRPAAGRDGRAFVLFRQHDHSRASGVMARHLDRPMSPRDAVIFAVAQHDRAWRPLDAELRWNPETGRPYDFTDFPLAEKLAAYRRGIDEIQAADPYAACLCSMHYASFFDGAETEEERAFAAAERRRQQRLRRSLSPAERHRLPDNLQLLQFCDDLSLFLCLNEPGKNTFPWFREGLDDGGCRRVPRWRDAGVLSLEPSPFAAAFRLRLPYRKIDEQGRQLGAGTLTVTITGGQE